MIFAFFAITSIYFIALDVPPNYGKWGVQNISLAPLANSRFVPHSLNRGAAPGTVFKAV